MYRRRVMAVLYKHLCFLDADIQTSPAVCFSDDVSVALKSLEGVARQGSIVSVLQLINVVDVNFRLCLRMACRL